MNERLNNPFNITKATDFSDEELIKFWVDFPEGSFIDVVKPTSAMPMLILGGKGSGKTHIMKYFSYELQKIRCRENLQNELRENGYLGIYMRCGGLNSSRFQGKGQPLDTWTTIFQYYLEIWLAQIILNIVIDIYLSLSTKLEDEEKLTLSILELFDSLPESERPTTIQGLFQLLSGLQKGVDIIVNNAGITKDVSKLLIHVTPGKLIFGIPRLLSTHVDLFANIRFLYLLDEFENLPIDHQAHINSLLRERQDPTTFKIGSRLYGVKTYKTLGSGEENKEGSEFEAFIIDKYFRENRGYESFVTQLSFKRLVKSGFPVLHSPEELNMKLFDEYFTQFEVDKILEEIISQGDDRKYFNRLKRQMVKVKASVTENIVENLRCASNPIVEKTNILLFYRAWRKLRNVTEAELLKISEDVKKECIKYSTKDPSGSLVGKVLDKFKNDIIAQLLRDYDKDAPYFGFKAFIDMSGGLPRNLLGILKYVFKKSYFNGEEPFNGGQISLEAQQKGVRDATEWFLENARMPGENGRKAKKSIIKLATYFREIRFSDVPPECSLCSFSIDRSTISDAISTTISNCELNSYLILLQGSRKDRNSERLDDVFQIHGMIAPKWDLPIYKRGEIHLQTRDAKEIFDEDSENDEAFKTFLRLKVGSYNVPFKNKEINGDSLFLQ